MRIHLNKLRAIGADVEPAEIEFGDGLTVISGASNTGKSYIQMCLYYMLGGEKPPKDVDGNDPYHTLMLELTAEASQSATPITLQRGLKTGGDVAIHDSAMDGIEPGATGNIFSWKHSAKNTRNLSRILLQLCSIDGKLIQPSAKKLRMLTFAELKRFLLINESMIIGDYSPVFPGNDRTDIPIDKAVFDFLISGQDATGAVVAPDVKVEKAKWKARGELIDKWMAEVTEQLAILDPLSAEEVDELEKRREVVLAAISGNRASIESNNLVRRQEYAQLQKHQARTVAIQQLLFRFNLLREHYESDVERLKFVSEGEYLLSQLSEVTCPLCQSKMSAPTSEAVPAAVQKKTIQQACSAERQKIEKNMVDLRGTVAELEVEQAFVEQAIAACQSRIKAIERAINEDLHPALTAAHQELERIAETRQSVAVAETLQTRLVALGTMKTELGPEPKQSRKKEKAPAPVVHQKARRVFCDEVERLLREWRYPKVGTVEFDEKMDLVVNGFTRFSQGKGHRAVLYAAFTIALMNVATSRHPHFVVIDSPLTSYKPGDNYRVENDLIRGFYTSLATTLDDRQVVIIENDDPPADLVPSMNHHHFSGPHGAGRQGFYPNNGSGQ